MELSNNRMRRLYDMAYAGGYKPDSTLDYYPLLNLLDSKLAAFYKAVAACGGFTSVRLKNHLFKSFESGQTVQKMVENAGMNQT